MAKRGGDGASKTEVAVETIRDRILDLTLPPGSRVDEKLLMDRFGISRTPAREALNRLATEGLVEIRANRGAFVRSMDIDDIACFLQAYFVAERSAGYFCRFDDPGLVEDMLAIQRGHAKAVEENRFLDISKANVAFHCRIARATGNPYLLDFSSRIHNMSRRLIYFVYHTEAAENGVLDAQQARIVAEHDDIIDCIRVADRDRLVAALTSHAERFQSRLARFLSRERGAGFPLA